MFKNDPGYPMRLAVSFILVSLVLFLLVVLVPWKSDAAEFYQFTDRDGTIHFVSRAEDVPKAYQSQAVLRDTDEVPSDKITPHNTTAHAEALSARLERLREVNSPDASTPETCDGHLAVSTERIQMGEYNRTMYIATDECGHVISVTPFYPDLDINR